MKTILTLLSVIALAGVAYAGCGKKVTAEGELKAYDADAKSITVKGEKGKIKLTPATEVKDADGKKVEISALVGKDVKVVSEHGKADSVTGA